MVTIRAARPSDAAGIRAVYAPFVAGSAATFEEEVPTVEDFHTRMLTSPLRPWLVAETGGGIAGYAYASAHHPRASYRWSVDTSIYLAAAHHRQGLGRRLYDRLIAEVRALGYLNLYAAITLPNAASVALHTAVGFRPVGVYPNSGYKLGAWHDVGWFGLTPVDEHPADPAEPRPWLPGGEPTAR
ncbi:GNAT family N-acetyltransferase [Frankia sp. QA3]|uniref:GNAT family N-acetyltransferase n=1 Tax=Frankia sp. QA3 TaxID=710111 RepID=UPI000269BE42|nr:GNAT family N-acetyltransferase [Frankia sp. QA3]EIV91881.1 sortase-like acyltransferase [Frankia sp. QA3]